MTNFTVLLRSTFGLLYRFPIALFALQALDLISEAAIQRWQNDQAGPLVMIMLFALTWMLTSFGMSATYAYLQPHFQGQAPSMGRAFATLKLRGWRLIQAQLLVGAVVGLGLIVILPGIYFLTIYMLVPLCVIEWGRSTFVSLSQSQKLARKIFFRLALFAVLILLLGLGMGELDRWISPVFRLIFTLVLSATINTFLSVLFVHLQRSEGSLDLV